MLGGCVSTRRALRCAPRRKRKREEAATEQQPESVGLGNGDGATAHEVDLEVERDAIEPHVCERRIDAERIQYQALRQELRQEAGGVEAQTDAEPAQDLPESHLEEAVETGQRKRTGRRQQKVATQEIGRRPRGRVPHAELSLEQELPAVDCDVAEIEKVRKAAAAQQAVAAEQLERGS